MKTKTLDVVMIATTTKTNLLLSAFNTLFLSPPMEVRNTDKYQCLCFTSNDEIKEGDWYLEKERFTDGTVKTKKDFDNAKWVVNQCTKKNIPYIERAINGKNASNGLLGILKIEATTHPLLHAKFGNDGEFYGMIKGGISSIPKLFVKSYIKTYNFGNPILTVDVELMFQLHDGTETTELLNNRIKTNPANEVIIVESKLYTKEEVIDLLHKVIKDAI